MYIMRPFIWYYESNSLLQIHEDLFIVWFSLSIALQLFIWSSHWWEEHVSDSWNGSLEAKFNTVINCLWANDSSFLGKEFKSTDTSSGLIILNAF